MKYIFKCFMQTYARLGVQTQDALGMLFKYLFNIDLVVVSKSDFILINKRHLLINPTG